jgi:hypothetical protein
MHVCVVLVTVTGATFAWMKYAMKGRDEFAVVNHPLEPWMLAAHVVVAPLLVFGFGWIGNTHIWPGFRQRGVPNRRSGVGAMWMIVPMTLSGYLLQVSVADGARKGSAAVHWVTSAVFVLGYSIHLYRRRLVTTRGRPDLEGEESRGARTGNHDVIAAMGPYETSGH